MSESEDFLDVESESERLENEISRIKLNRDNDSAIFSIGGPNSITDDEEEFYDVIEMEERHEEAKSEPKVETEIEAEKEEQNSLQNSSHEISVKSDNSDKLSVLEFLQEGPEIAEQSNKRETIYEFLASTSDLSHSEKEKESESSLSKLQSELNQEDNLSTFSAEGEREDRFDSEGIRMRRSILNLPSNNFNNPSAPPLPPRRESLLRRANPLAGFFATENGHDSDDSDSMISELTETLTSRTEVSDLQLSRNTSVLQGDYLKLARRYKPVPVKVKSKQKSEFSSLFLIQELNRRQTTQIQSPRSSSVISDGSAPATDPSKAIFVLKFSPDGHFLAAAGAEGIVKIWSLLQVDTETTPARLATIFENEPVQILKGHTAEILDCAWSVNNFLLTASMDRTVRLWHHSRSDALGIFQHLDYVTSVAFHPRDPRIFLSGSLDCKLRLWSIQDRTILHWNELPPGNFITAVAFNRNGTTVIAGTSGGAALIFDTEGLRYNTQILVRSSRSKTFGKKITSIESVPGQYDNDERILISSNDSRIRMYSLRDKNVIYKYKGHENVSSQIGASLGTDADFILSGSEDCRVYLWRSDGKFQKKGIFSSFRKDHIESYESFKAHSNPVTAAIIAPNCVTNILQSYQLRPPNSLQSTEGKIIITADVTGQIKVFENNSKLIEWLK